MNIRASNLKSQVVGLAFIALSLLTSACGKVEWVKDAEFSTYQDSAKNTFAKATVYLNTGSVGMGTFTLPIVDPRKPTVTLGHLSSQAGMFNDHGKANYAISIDVNMTYLMKNKSPGQTPVLPNGNPLPITGYPEDKVYMFTFSKTTIRAYVGVDTTTRNAFFGVAIPVKELKVPTDGDWFMPFDLQNGVGGLFGFFFGQSNGVGLFVDFSDVFGTKDMNNLMANSDLKMSKATSSAPKQFLIVEPSARDQQKVTQKLQKLNSKRATLTIQ